MSCKMCISPLFVPNTERAMIIDLNDLVLHHRVDVGLTSEMVPTLTRQEKEYSEFAFPFLRSSPFSFDPWRV